MAKPSPTSRSKQHLEKLGYTVATLERWNHFAKIRQDVWGADLLAARSREPLLAIQCTTTANMSARLQKCALAARIWTETGNRFEVWGFSKRGAKGKKKEWTLTKIALDTGKKTIVPITTREVPGPGNIRSSVEIDV